MGISRINKLNALVRSELYRFDYKEYSKNVRNQDFFITEGMINYISSLSDEAKALCRKWGLLYPVNPAARPIEDYLPYLTRPIEFLPDPSQWKTSQANTVVGSEEKTFTHINGKLALLIDLNFPREKLRSEFDHFLKRWGEKQKKRDHQGIPSVWEVYDKSKQGMNMLQITREMFEIEDKPENNPNYNEHVDNLYQKVKRAYQSACKHIKAIEKAASL